ncbi:UNVERIFIED_ORG: hypothetical protein BTE55_32410 [Rhizobium sophorae]
MPMPRVALYARYSSDLQNPRSADDQFLICRQFAEQQGWQVVGCYRDEAVSGASLRGRDGIRSLLADVKGGQFEFVCAEALDRISRDQEDMAHVYKLLRFAGVILHTVSDGRADELQIGFRGTMNALYLKDLADKTRRGQRGRVEKGRSGGGLAYGYKIFADDEDGAGGRRINEAEAAIVRRIFMDFARGETPVAIAMTLNKEAIPGPAGRPWAASTIRGHRSRGTGILNNELYQGVLIWNRLRYVKDPGTGKRQARRNPETDWVTTDVASLRIIEEPLWQAVKNRQQDIEQRFKNVREGVQNSREARSRGLTVSASYLYRLLVCADCGCDFCHVGRDRYGCAGHYRRKCCDNGKTIQRHVMEKQVRAVLVETLFTIERHFAALVTEDRFDHHERSRKIQNDRRELERIEGRLRGLLAAIEDGLYTPRLKERFQQLEGQAERLRAKLEIYQERLETRNFTSQSFYSRVRALIENLPDSSDEKIVLQLRHIAGPIKVTPGKSRKEFVFALATQGKLISRESGDSIPSPPI